MPKSSVVVGSLELNYSLAELPTSQHRAGLVGLLLVIDELTKAGVTGASAQITEDGASIQLEESGLKAILNEIYAATEELQSRETPLKGVEPTEVREEKVLDKKGKEKTKKYYYYPAIVPRGSFLDTADDSEKKVWVKLWRAMTWQILRGVPATRKPFEDRAAKKEPSDVGVLWKQLNQDKDKSVDLPSTYFVGAQASNAERVPFKDNGRAQFLLHFWPFICQIYRPQEIDRDGKRNFVGYVIAVPDVAMLRSFKADYLKAFENRSPDSFGSLPKEAIIEIPEEAGLDYLLRISTIVSQSAGKLETSDLIYGIDIFHTAREGNNVRLLYSGRVEPDIDRDHQYATLKSRLRNSSFKRQRLTNLLRRTCWYDGFDNLISLLPIDNGLCSPFFAHDAKLSLESEAANHSRRNKMKVANGQALTSEDVSLEALTLSIVDGYLRRKLKDKYALEWTKIQDDPRKRAEYSERRESLGKECFYAIRSRTGDDFINYFASTICSVSHWMTQEEYLCITRKLYEDTEKIRTLSLLALSAKIVKEKKEDVGNE